MPDPNRDFLPRIAVCVGMSPWKRRRVAEFLRAAGDPPVFRNSVAGALAAAARCPGGAIAVWASRMPEGLEEAAVRHGVPLVRVEDGFIRSFGLGSDFRPPCSLVFDTRGIYFDPNRPGDLAAILRETRFDAALVARARRLVELIVSRGITKYGQAAGGFRFDWPPARRRVLVPGQVEDDRSVLLGGGNIRGNLALLAQVRAENPEAHIVYKPHPDVVAGHRRGAVAVAAARQFADAVVADAPMAALLDQIDELHTLTSLSGFEALLRGRRVVTYGRPFYAGWGLTEDRVAGARGRRLGLEELAAGVLILYPRYLDPLTRRPCGPEQIIERFGRRELWRAGPIVRARQLQGRVRGWWAGRSRNRAAVADAGGH